MSSAPDVGVRVVDVQPEGPGPDYRGIDRALLDQLVTVLGGVAEGDPRLPSTATAKIDVAAYARHEAPVGELDAVPAAVLVAHSACRACLYRVAVEVLAGGA